MDITLLAALTVLCGGAAIYFWLASSKLQDQIGELKGRIDKAESESSKAADKAEQLRKKYESEREHAAREDRSIKEAKARATEAKEELKKVQAALKRAEQTAHDEAAKARKAESRAEELSHALAESRGKKPVAPPPVAATPEPPRPAPERVEAPREDDPKIALRRAELEAERQARQLELEKLRAERDAAHKERQENKDREFIEKLKADREQLKQMVFERELTLRLLRRKAEDNRRAYIVTMGALDLAEDELYRLKHGRERPELQVNRAGEFQEMDDQDAATDEALAQQDVTAEVEHEVEPGPQPEGHAAAPEPAPESAVDTAETPEPVPARDVAQA